MRNKKIYKPKMVHNNNNNNKISKKRIILID